MDSRSPRPIFLILLLPFVKLVEALKSTLEHPLHFKKSRYKSRYSQSRRWDVKSQAAGCHFGKILARGLLDVRVGFRWRPNFPDWVFNGISHSFVAQPTGGVVSRSGP